ncbi:MAG: PVC-type heme-binding CxxCH protein, partial [Opitutaceae bacterium]
MISRRIAFFFRQSGAAAPLLLFLVQLTAAERTAPLPPAAALDAFQLEAGLRIELVAAEPLVVSPVAFAFDENRRLYVVEARGYPDSADGKPITTLGRIALLEDTDADGVYDRRREFATDFTNPNGIVVWRGGVFVTCAPDIFYLKDTNGDGVADERRVVLTGFDTSQTSQTRVSSPTFGLDGKIYVACGGSGGKVTSPEHPDRAPVVFSPTDGRFNPETLVYESIGGGGQFGLSFDAFGRRFTSSSRDPVRHAVLEPWFLKRNPHLAFTEKMQAVSKRQAEAKVSPISRSSVSADFIPGLLGKPHSGTLTSACGLVVFDGSGMSPEHVGNVFICEPAQNLVQRQVFRPAGASFRSDPPYQGREFLASTDVWFRPVFLANGPDGALYLADMHRREIDHPRFVPAESRAKLDFERGKSAGRIYRVSRGKRAPRSTSAMSIVDLCRGIESPDSWTRERAQRLLIEKADMTAVPLLEQCLNGAEMPEARTRALWTLRGLRQLSAAAISTALRDSDPGVREQGVLLLADFREKMPELSELLLAAANDPAARVRFVSALELGSM